MDNWAPRILVCRSARIGEGKPLGEHVVVHDVDEVSVEAEHDFASGGFGADFQAVVCPRVDVGAALNLNCLALRSI